jgi:hypothetical protein
VLLAAVGWLPGGCEVGQLHLAYQTNVGINAAIKPDMTEGSLMIGYQRDFATLVPKSVAMQDGTGKRDAMASLVCSELVVQGIWLNKYVEYVATGDAAKDFAARLMGQQTQADKFFDCYKEPAVTGGGGN